MKKYEDKKLEEASEFNLLKKFPIKADKLGNSPNTIQSATWKAEEKYGDKFNAVRDEWVKQAKALDKKTKSVSTSNTYSRLIPKNMKFWYVINDDRALFSDVKLNGLYKEY